MQPIRRVTDAITMQFIRRLAWITVGFTYILVSMGVTVRANDAGLSCPDWPLCYGRLFFSGNYGALLEESHRYIAGIVSVLIVVLALSILIRARKDQHLLVPALLAPVLLAVQIMLGGMTVLWKLSGPIITSHMAVAEALLATIITIAIMAGKPEATREPREKTRQFARLAMVASLLPTASF